MGLVASANFLLMNMGKVESLQDSVGDLQGPHISNDFMDHGLEILAEPHAATSNLAR